MADPRDDLITDLQLRVDALERVANRLVYLALSQPDLDEEELRDLRVAQMLMGPTAYLTSEPAGSGS